MGQSRFHQGLLIPLGLLAAVVRVVGLNAQPLWWDEGYSLYASAMPLPQMIAETAEDIHPPLYYALLHLWQMAGGDSALTARLLSVFTGLLVVWLTVRFAWRIGGDGLAWPVGVSAAISPLLIYYSQEIRMYGLVTLLGLLSTLLMWRWLDRAEAGAPERPWLIAYTAATAAMLYTHYFAVLVPVAHTLFVLLHSHHRRRVLIRWLASQAALVALYLPWVVYTAARLASYVQGKTAIERYQALDPLAYVWRHLFALSVGHASEPSGWLLLPALASAGLAALGGVLAFRRMPEDRSRLAAVAALQVCVALVGGFLINVVYPFHPRGFERLLLFIAPAFYVLIGLGLLWLWRRRRVVSVAVLALIVSGSTWSLLEYYAVARYPEDDYASALSELRRWAQPGDAVLCLYPWQIGYLRAADGLPALNLVPAFREDWTVRGARPDVLPDYLDRLMNDNHRLWFPSHQIGGRILETEMERYLAARYATNVSLWPNPHTRLWLFTASPSLASGRADFERTLRLIGWGLPRDPVKAGQALPVQLRWELTAAPTDRLYVGLRLVDDADNTWAQQAGEPLGGTRPFADWTMGSPVEDGRGLLVPPDTPPGRYSIKLGVFRSSDDRGLDVLDANAIPQGVEVDLGPVEIARPDRPAPADLLAIQHRTKVEWAGGEQRLLLLGSAVGDGPHVPGSVLPVTLFWEPVTPLAADLSFAPQLVDANGQPIGADSESAVLERYPTSLWAPGFAVRDPRRLVIPPQTPAGIYTLRVSVSGGPTGLALADGRGAADLLQIEVSGGRPHSFTPPTVETPLVATFGDAIRLLGHGFVPDQAAPGQTLNLRLYWQALAPMQASYTVFVHLIDESQRLWGQTDTPPGNGTLPTTGWVQGEYLEDGYAFQVKPDAPAGRYRIELGVYDAATGRRLLVRLERTGVTADHLLLEPALTLAP